MGFQAQNFFSVFGQFYTFISGIFIRCSGFLALICSLFSRCNSFTSIYFGLSRDTREIPSARLAAETEPLIFLLLLIFYKKAVLRDA
jgi:hypothetical protein